MQTTTQSPSHTLKTRTHEYRIRPHLSRKDLYWVEYRYPKWFSQWKQAYIMPFTLEGCMTILDKMQRIDEESKVKQ